MFKKTLLSLYFSLLSIQLFANQTTIKAIFIDVETLFETHDMKAAKYIGTIDSLRYLKALGHTPSQKDLFYQLSNAQSESTEMTYNNGLPMPLIFSDWLTNIQPASDLTKQTLKFLNTLNIFDIEKKVLGNIVKMMMNPTSLADIQKIISITASTIKKLKLAGYKVYLVGNWANLTALKEAHPSAFIDITDTIFSGNIHKLKPNQTFYDTVIAKSGFNKEETLWIEKETEFIKAAKKYDLKVIKFDKASLKSDFKSFGINL